MISFVWTLLMLRTWLLWDLWWFTFSVLQETPIAIIMSNYMPHCCLLNNFFSLTLIDTSTLNGLRKIHIPGDLISHFLRIASENTRKNLETCGILTGRLVSKHWSSSSFNKFLSWGNSVQWQPVNTTTNGRQNFGQAVVACKRKETKIILFVAGYWRQFKR